MSTRVLKVYDIDLLIYTPLKDEKGKFCCRVEKVYEENRGRLPLDLELSDDGLRSWITKRTIPKNRTYVDNLLAKLGLNSKNTQEVIDICFGLSLNDSFWIVPENFKHTFRDCNLYQNKFTEFVSEIAFSGLGSFSHPTSTTSPEFTTGGMLPKAWRQIEGKTYLFKGGTIGYANAGNEPYSEFYAAQIADVLGFEHTFYDLKIWKAVLCSACELWTDINTSFISTGRLVPSGSFDDVFAYYSALDENSSAGFVQSLINLLVFDAIIINEDRHLGNFGLLIDSQENKIIRPAPIFDNGLSLLWSGLQDDVEHWKDFANTRLPRVYDDFIETVKKYIAQYGCAGDLKNVEKLVNFKFKRHSEHNFPEERLIHLEELVQCQVQKLLK
jgi:hypothetical protein